MHKEDRKKRMSERNKLKKIREMKENLEINEEVERRRKEDGIKK